MRKYCLLKFSAALSCAFLSFAAESQSLYRATVLRDLAQVEPPSNFPNGLNDRGQAVGQSRDDAGVQQAVLWSDDEVEALQPQASAVGINNRSQVVGDRFVLDGTLAGRMAFRWWRGELLDLGDFPGGALQSSAADINSRGQIVGRGCREDGCVAFLWERGELNALEELAGGPVEAAALAINDRGEIVGSSVGPDRTSAVLWQDGVLIELPALPMAPGRRSVAAAIDINNSGQIVGQSSENFGGSRAVLWQEGQVEALPMLPGYTGSFARAINERGTIVGGALDPFLQERAVLWHEGIMIDLNDADIDLPETRFLQYIQARAINERGQVLVWAIDTTAPESPKAVLLTPVRSDDD